ncbi:ribonuclease R [Fundicoccus culcitae]|uniref:Ribonuclease R n=1 Tax=Fundicoccus culcitae TaxID=2969821 RepID=A0ABY5P660_9LACT|nr:ribonuclease R [Fundicoccus culcitae]UUX34224.1 ribonuclease R [Fundicoccus culcitae]
MSLTSLEKKVLTFLKENKGKSFKTDEIAQHFNYKGTKNYKKLIKALAFLERVHEIEVDETGRFQSISEDKIIVGTYRANDRGFGFIEYDENKPDLFVPPKQSGAAMNGDKVEVLVTKSIDPATGKGSEAEVINVIERSATSLVGVFTAFDQNLRQETGFLGSLKPQGDYSDLVTVFIKPDGIHPADQTICLIEITAYPQVEEPNHLEGVVTKEIGHKDAPGVDILAILYQFGIPSEFPQAVIDEADAIPQVIDQEQASHRRDLRDELVITIDGADAKDLDDAISLKLLTNGNYQLGVHIADVSQYVKEQSPIDQEAYERGTSVYLTDRVVPMLPQRLSNGICSLHAHEDRLTVSCVMEVNNAGKVVDYDIFLSVINSSYRMTYDNVNLILDGDEPLRQEYAEIVPMLEDMYQLHLILEEMRHQRGALDFDAPEAKIIVDENGHPIDIELRERWQGERLIESFMLCANETIAHHYTQREIPFIYRIHEQPDEDRMQRFAEFLTSFGVILRGNVEAIQPKQLQEALEEVKDHPYYQAVSTMMLRSMKQAKYSDEPIGHYGLAAADYTHFTSPIRRYPDLIVHRIIHLDLAHQLSNKEKSRWQDILPEIADHSSKMERRSVDAERETDALKKAEYMVDKVGQQFDGIISSVTSFGIFVQLPNTVEGLITLRKLTDDFYTFNQEHMLLIGERTNKIYRIGQSVVIEVDRVNVAEKEIDFNLIKAEPIEDIDLTQLNRQKQLAKNKQKKDQNKNKMRRHAKTSMKQSSSSGKRNKKQPRKRK